MKPLVRTLARSIPLLALVALAVAGPAAGEVRAGDPCYHGFGETELTVVSGGSVEAQACAFSPTIAVIEPGATVTFRNGPGLVHLVTGANQAWGSRDTELQPNATMTVTFDEPGVYPYACALHRGMSGAIVVGDGGAALAAAMRSAAEAPSAVVPSAVTPAVAGEPAATVDPVPVAWVGLGLVGVLGAIAVAVALRRREPRPGTHAAPVL